ncbi:MAG: hypothetical protein ACOYJ1_09285 [Peptococcales bacterium]|jgi:hypothetical protein
MLPLIRRGPKILIIESGEPKQLIGCFNDLFQTLPCTFEEAFENSTEDHTIIFIVEKLTDIVHHDEVKYFYLIHEDCDVVLCTILNKKICSCVNRARIAPRTLIMRAFGDLGKVIQELKKNYGSSTTGSFLEMWDQHNSGTILALTHSPLNQKLSLCELYPVTLFIERKYSELRRDLGIHGLKYLNQGLNNSHWQELEIKIYDQYEEYILHYERLIKIIEFLELGIILGESWGQDTALIFNVIEVYRIHFFTFHDPQYIKKILLGLEYLEDETRIVDFDLFYRRKKISWTDIKQEITKNKRVLSKKYRKEIFDKLNPEQKAQIIELEKKIIATRY